MFEDLRGAVEGHRLGPIATRFGAELLDAVDLEAGRFAVPSSTGEPSARCRRAATSARSGCSALACRRRSSATQRNAGSCACASPRRRSPRSRRTPRPSKRSCCERGRTRCLSRATRSCTGTSGRRPRLDPSWFGSACGTSSRRSSARRARTARRACRCSAPQRVLRCVRGRVARDHPVRRPLRVSPAKHRIIDTGASRSCRRRSRCHCSPSCRRTRTC